MGDIVERIEEWFLQHGSAPCPGARREPVSPLEHALQCAQLAEYAHAPGPLVVAALLHDLGHLLDPSRGVDDVDDGHETSAAAALEPHFERAVVEPIRLHVDAKRYLTAVDAAYFPGLSPASAHSLALQGGPMTPAERHRFASRPFADDAVRLRRWDDLAKLPGRLTPPLAYYLALVSEVRATAPAR